MNRLAVGMAVAAGLAVVGTLADPGLTIDEPLDVRPGRTYVGPLPSDGLGVFPARRGGPRVRRQRRTPSSRPLAAGGRLHARRPRSRSRTRGVDPIGLYVVSGRLAPALAFAVLRGDRDAGLGSPLRPRGGGPPGGLALLFMPRVFSHAHLGGARYLHQFLLGGGVARGGRAAPLRRPVRGWRGAGALFVWRC